MNVGILIGKVLTTLVLAAPVVFCAAIATLVARDRPCGSPRLRVAIIVLAVAVTGLVLLTDKMIWFQ